MSVGNYTLRRTYVDGDVLSASDYVADHQQHITNQNPTATGAYSDDLAEMRSNTDTGDVGSESLATTLGGELERIRFTLKHIKEKINGSSITTWYSKTYGIGAATITAAKLADGATFLQFLRAVGSNVTVSSASDTTLVSQAITTTRTRVRVTVVAHFHVSDSGAISTDTLIVKLKRGSTTKATAKVFPSVATGDFSMPTAVIEYVDNPGAGTTTYNVTGILSTASLGCAVNDVAISIEEIA